MQEGRTTGFGFTLIDLLSSYQPPALTGVPNVNTSYSYNLDGQLTQEQILMSSEHDLFHASSA